MRLGIFSKNQEPYLRFYHASPQNGEQSPDPIPGRTRNYSPENNVTVITDSDGTVVTVINGRR